MHQKSNRAATDSERSRKYRKPKPEDKTSTIYRDSRMTQDSLKNSNILIEEIRRKLTGMGKTKWKIQFGWVKAHIGIQGNELPDTLAKEAATKMDIKESYKKSSNRCSDK